MPTPGFSSRSFLDSHKLILQICHIRVYIVHRDAYDIYVYNVSMYVEEAEKLLESHNRNAQFH